MLFSQASHPSRGCVASLLCHACPTYMFCSLGYRWTMEGSQFSGRNAYLSLHFYYVLFTSTIAVFVRIRTPGTHPPRFDQVIRQQAVIPAVIVSAFLSVSSHSQCLAMLVGHSSWPNLISMASIPCFVMIRLCLARCVSSLRLWLWAPLSPLGDDSHSHGVERRGWNLVAQFMLAPTTTPTPTIRAALPS
ncbi:unnamed protein product [Mycena citricolor]|uniref:Uncharacterized protein n=1 Tax=Mycena citricolor TaxID=2018698 RepID=A0AAD2JVC0_9AGAR|nr:unnamed protein product [Mycena citricolor]